MASAPDSIDDLIPAPYNPRTISPEALDGLRASVDRFGDLSGLVWNAITGHLVAGHQRMRALKDAGATFRRATKTLPARFTLGKRAFPIRVVEWGEAEEKAANVVANNTQTAGTFTDALASVIDDARPAVGDDFDALRFSDLLAEHTPDIAPDPPPPELEFSAELLERHNYIVFTFDNVLDWQVVREAFNIHTVHGLDSRPDYRRAGVGRVFPGAKLLALLDSPNDAPDVDTEPHAVESAPLDSDERTNTLAKGATS